MVNPLKIVVSDPIVSRFESRFRQLVPEHEWHFIAGLPSEDQSEQIAEADVLVCAKLSPEDAQRCQAGLVHVTGSGTDRVALASLPKTTRVATTSHHERSIAEHILMVILAHERRLFEVTNELRDGLWKTVATDQTVPMFRTFKDLTIGFIGMGGIGRQTLAAVSALGAKSVAVRRNISATAEADENLLWVKSMEYLPLLLESSDVVILGLPLTDETQNLLGAKEFGLMREDALLINVSRGPIVDAQALLVALERKSIGCAALDVWWEAPLNKVAPELTQRLAAHPQVIATPHYSGHAKITFEPRVNEICKNIDDYATQRSQLVTAAGAES
ncbi:NAD(P)-dependent oxidoreductase [Glutamicibacter ectropisis]|uniref:NAD(P)-dependent oxidoreductase n=1 Tax=Glutamicibacter ectropisis TaxID=3046593 RepID=A0AAU6WCD6_9MICC